MKLQAIREHFLKFSNYDAGDPNISFDPIPPLFVPIEDGPFIVQELTLSVKHFGRGRAPGSDGIPMEALQAIASHEVLREQLLGIINKVYETGSTDEAWRMTLQIPIPKKGDLTDISNWRPICVVNSVVKLMNHMILSRIRPRVEGFLRDNQYGFRPNRSTAGAQIIMNEVKTKAFRKDGIMVAFVDFAKAFPSVSFDAIKACLNAFRVGNRLSTTILSIYRDLKGTVRTPFGNTEPFPITTGILQGDVLAPYLFVMVMDRILHMALDDGSDGVLLKSRGTRKRGLNEKRLSDIDYADDVALFSDSMEGLQNMINSVSREAEKANLRLAVGQSKTAWISFGKVARSENDPVIYNNNLEVPKVGSYRHPGQRQDQDFSSTVKDRLKLAWGSLQRLNGIWSSPLSEGMKFRLYDALVYPVLNFGMGAVHISQKELRKIGIEVNTMRRIATRSNKVDE